MLKISHTTIFETETFDNAVLIENIQQLIGDAHNNPDYFELETGSIRQSISIEQTRELINWLQLKPYQAPKKLALIKEAEKLTVQAQNSLLKTLEEPPSHSYIFLITRNHKSLLKTILSRSRLVRLDKAKREEKAPIKNILGSSITEQIDLIENLVKIKNPVERKGSINEFLSNLNQMVLEQKNSQTKLKNLKLLETTFQGMQRNVNNRLLLENLLFNLVFP